MKPELLSEVILDKVTLIKNGSEEHVRIEASRQVNGIQQAYHISIKPQKGTYITTKKDTVNKQTKLSVNSFETLSSTNYYAWVKAVTDDPVGEDLCYTELRSNWIDFGTTIDFGGNNLNAWVVNPSQFDTYWYIEDSTPYDPYLYYDNQKLRQEGSADYYNYDFGQVTRGC